MENNVKVGKKIPVVAIVAALATVVIIAVSIIVIKSKSDGIGNVDGKYKVTYHTVNGIDKMDNLSRGKFTVEIKDGMCRMGGEPKYEMTFNGNKVIMKNGYKTFEGTYDKKTRTFSLKGTHDEKDREYEYKLEYDPD